jgi:hypothetical protein
MKKFVIKDSEGNVLRVGQCLDVDFHLQANEGEFIYEGEAEIPQYEDPPSWTLRSIRNSLLTECDWTQMPDAPLSKEAKLQWATYRQELRDLPSNYPNLTSMDNVVFPEKP